MPSEIAKLVRTSFPLGIFATGHYMMASLQPVLIGFLLGPSMVTAFYVPFRLITILNTGAFQVVIPKFAPFTMAVCSGRSREAASIFSQTFRIFSGCIILTSLLFVSLTPQLLALMRMPPVSLSVLILLTIDSALFFICGSCADFVIASGKGRFLWSTIAWISIGVLAGIPLTTNYGIIGAVSTTILAGLASRHIHCVIEAIRMKKALNS